MKKYSIVSALVLFFVLITTAHAGFFDWFKNTPLNLEAQAISALKASSTEDMLKDLGYISKDLVTVPEQVKTDAIKKFQKDQKLRATGKLDSKTKSKLYRVRKTSIKKQTASNKKPPTPSTEKSLCITPPPDMISWWLGDTNAADHYGMNNR